MCAVDFTRSTPRGGGEKNTYFNFFRRYKHSAWGKKGRGKARNITTVRKLFYCTKTRDQYKFSYILNIYIGTRRLSYSYKRDSFYTRSLPRAVYYSFKLSRAFMYVSIFFFFSYWYFRPVFFILFPRVRRCKTIRA